MIIPLKTKSEVNTIIKQQFIYLLLGVMLVLGGFYSGSSISIDTPNSLILLLFISTNVGLIGGSILWASSAFTIYAIVNEATNEQKTKILELSKEYPTVEEFRQKLIFNNEKLTMYDYELIKVAVTKLIKQNKTEDVFYQPNINLLDTSILNIEEIKHPNLITKDIKNERTY